MMVELIYDRDCPNVSDARENLLKALSLSDREIHWTEWERGAPDSPARVNSYGSPTVLVGGKDVAGDTSGADTHNGESPSCRLYRNASGRSAGVPSVEQIVAALAGPSEARWKNSLVTVPGIAVAFLPNLACPLCWPAYAGLLGALGLGLLLEESYLIPLTAALLALAVGALAFRARMRRGYGPFAFGLWAGIFVLVGKFAIDSDPAVYGGVAALVAASVWNGWPMRRRGCTCPTCEPEASLGLCSTLSKETSS